MKLKHTTVAIAGIGMMLASCQKDQPFSGKNAPQNQTKSTDIIGPFFAANQASNAELFTVNAATGGVFYMVNGTRITVAASAFRNPNGSVTQGNVRLSVLAITTRFDALINNMPTESLPAADGSGGGPIATGGAYKIDMKNAAGAAVTAPGTGVVFSVPASLTGGINTSMVMWTGAQSPAQTRDMAWQPNNSAPAMTSTTYDFPAPSSLAYNIDSYQDWLNWVNGSMLRVSLPTGFDDGNTEVFATYKNRPGILTSLDKYVPATETSAAYWTENNAYLSAGQEGSIIAVSKGADGGLRTQIRSYTLGTSTISLNNLSVTTVAALKEAVDALE